MPSGRRAPPRREFPGHAPGKGPPPRLRPQKGTPRATPLEGTPPPTTRDAPPRGNSSWPTPQGWGLQSYVLGRCVLGPRPPKGTSRATPLKGTPPSGRAPTVGTSRLHPGKGVPVRPGMECGLRFQNWSGPLVLMLPSQRFLCLLPPPPEPGVTQPKRGRVMSGPPQRLVRVEGRQFLALGSWRAVGIRVRDWLRMRPCLGRGGLLPVGAAPGLPFYCLSL